MPEEMSQRRQVDQQELVEGLCGGGVSHAVCVFSDPLTSKNNFSIASLPGPAKHPISFKRISRTVALTQG